MGADTALRPGMWESEARFTSVQGNGPHAKATKALVGQPRVRKECATAAELDPAKRFAEIRTAGCTTSVFVVAGGKINIAGQCRKGVRAQTTRIVGTYTPTTYSTATTTSLADGGTATFTDKGRRIGNCSDEG